MSAAKPKPEPVDPSEVAAVLRKLLAALASGELTAPAGTAHRIEGVIVAMEAMAVLPKVHQKRASNA